MIVYMGISGSGKGTQCKMLSKELSYAYLAMSDLIRIYADESQQQKMRTGTLLQDGDAIAIVKTALAAQADPNKVILDGFPRTPGQASWLAERAETGDFRIEAVINLLLSEEKALGRLLLRARADDTPEIIRTRFEWYRSNVVPALDSFRRRDITVYDIDGDSTPEAVFMTTLRKLRTAAVVS